MASDVFISYATPDHELAARMCHDLDADGITCWIAPRDVTAGADYARTIATVIPETHVLVLLVSGASAASEHVDSEAHLAAGRKIPILPLRLDRATLAPWQEYFVSGRQYIDLFERPETKFPDVRRAVRTLL